MVLHAVVTSLALLLPGGAAAADDVTISISPSVIQFAQRPEITGSVTSGRSGVPVTVQFKQCGLYPAQFRDFLETTTEAGGRWWLTPLQYLSTNFGASGLVRAVAGGEVSNAVALRMRAFVQLHRRPGGRFQVQVGGTQSFWRKRVLVQRFNRRLGTWVTMRSLLLTESFGSRYYGGSGVSALTERFELRVPKGTTLRAVLPAAAARPCYLAGYSRLVRT
jgi:hypothetical protein